MSSSICSSFYEHLPMMITYIVFARRDKKLWWLPSPKNYLRLLHQYFHMLTKNIIFYINNESKKNYYHILISYHKSKLSVHFNIIACFKKFTYQFQKKNYTNNKSQIETSSSLSNQKNIITTKKNYYYYSTSSYREWCKKLMPLWNQKILEIQTQQQCIFSCYLTAVAVMRK